MSITIRPEYERIVNISGAINQKDFRENEYWQSLAALGETRKIRVQ
jgi:hypothetical protein